MMPAANSADAPMTAPDVQPLLQRLCDRAAPVVFFPVRHHSPACARQVDRLIRAIRPDAVLIEGPRDATHLIPLLTATGHDVVGKTGSAQIISAQGRAASSDKLNGCKCPAALVETVNGG